MPNPCLTCHGVAAPLGLPLLDSRNYLSSCPPAEQRFAQEQAQANATQVFLGTSVSVLQSQSVQTVFGIINGLRPCGLELKVLEVIETLALHNTAFVHANPNQQNTQSNAAQCPNHAPRTKADHILQAAQHKPCRLALHIIMGFTQRGPKGTLREVELEWPIEAGYWGHALSKLGPKSPLHQVFEQWLGAIETISLGKNKTLGQLLRPWSKKYTINHEPWLMGPFVGNALGGMVPPLCLTLRCTSTTTVPWKKYKALIAALAGQAQWHGL